jgi:ankyrin repeat protein
VERTFWIQGRTGRYWQNLESLESDQTAIVRLGALISEDRYDELRLIQAEVSTISGETEYTNVVTIRDGQVIDSPMLRAQRAANATLSTEDPGLAGDRIAEEDAGEGDDLDPDHHPQLRFWPTPNPEHMQGRLGLHGETQWAGDGSGSGDPAAEPRPVAPPRPPRRTAKFVPEATVRGPAPSPEISAAVDAAARGDYDPLAQEGDAPGTVGGWTIPSNAALGAGVSPRLPTEGQARAEAPRVPGPTPAASPSSNGGAEPHRPSLTADPGPRSGGRDQRRFRFGFSRRAGRGARSGTGSAGGRVALMSGVFAGALATGLALSAISPDFAGRFFTSISGQFGDILPRVDLADAVAQGDLPSVRARLAEGADPNTLDSEGVPVLLRAARTGNLAAVSLLLQAGADPTLPTEDGRSILHRVAAEGRGQAMMRMIDAGAPVDLAGGVYGCLTPLSVAAANGRSRVAALLAERGASFEARNGCTVGPMEIAAAHPHVLARLEQIRAEQDALLKSIASTDAARTRRPGTALVIAEDAVASRSDPAVERTGGEQGEPGAAADRLANAVAALDAAQDSVSSEPMDVPSVFDAPPALEGEISDEQAAVFIPPRKPEPPPAPKVDPRVFANSLRSAIDRGDEIQVASLLDRPPEGFSLDDARFAVEDGYGSGVRTPLEQATFAGRPDIVRLLADEGATIPPDLLHRAVQHADRDEMAGMVSVLLEHGADPNAMSDGLTPLMRASLKGDPQTAYVLMAFGADPSVVSADGRLASDFARDAGRPDMQERLVLASSEPAYRNLMMGLSWSDTLATLRDRIELCKDIADDFTACKLTVDTWMEDAKVVVAQFDRKASDRLVAIQIDSRPLTSPGAAVARFEAARRAIQDRIPEGHAGFVTREVGGPDRFFHELRPEINQGRYFSYWPDQDRRRPVFVHLKLGGLDDLNGFYRIVIGNPFRAG